MRRTSRISLLVGVCLLGMFSSRPLSAQACKDDEMMASENKKTVSELLQTVRKETLEEFQRAYHRNSSVYKLTFFINSVNGLVNCLEKAAQDPTATKEETDGYKAKRETYTKLKEKLEESRKAIKGATDNKDAKAVIEKIDLPN